MNWQDANREILVNGLIRALLRAEPAERGVLLDGLAPDIRADVVRGRDW